MTNPLDLTVREFLAVRKAKGWNFTVTWVQRRVKSLEIEGYEA